MPRASNLRTSQRQRPAPYETRSTTHNMAASIVSPYQSHFSSWEHTPYDPAHMIPMYINNIPAEPTYHTPHEIPTQAPHQRHQPRNSQSAPWTSQEDDVLRDCKRRGLQWDVIHRDYFPTKSGNACRKRFERMETKRRGSEWDEARLERLAVEYKRTRQQIWEPIARRLGEKWEHVEKTAMAEGVKALLNKASYHSRQISSGSSRSRHSLLEHEQESPQEEYDQENEGEDEDEDSGIGLGLGNGNGRTSRRTSHQHGRNTLDPGSLHKTSQASVYH